MRITQSFWRKVLVTAVAAGGFASLYEVTILDSRYNARIAPKGELTPRPAPGDRLTTTATAYCKGLTTTSGVAVQAGVAAADPLLLPVGSVVQVDLGNPRYDGIYTVMDTGPSVQGLQVDLYMWSCNEALQFGRQTATVTVLRLGWDPRATMPSFLGRFFGRQSDVPDLLPSRPLPQVPPIGVTPH